MSFDDLTRSAHATLGRALRGDEPLKLLRSHSLAGTLGEPVLLALEVAAEKGATEVLAQRPGETYLRGSAPAGLPLSVDGQSRILTEDAEASDGHILFHLDRPLDPRVETGAMVWLSATAEFSLKTARAYSARQQLIPRSFEGRVSFLAYLPKQGAPTEPRIGDLIESGTYRGTILGWLREDAGAWTALVGRTS